MFETFVVRVCVCVCVANNTNGGPMAVQNRLCEIEKESLERERELI